MAAGDAAWCEADVRGACAPRRAGGSAPCAAATAGRTRRSAGSGDEPAGGPPSTLCWTTPALVKVGYNFQHRLLIFFISKLLSTKALMILCSLGLGDLK